MFGNLKDAMKKAEEMEQRIAVMEKQLAYIIQLLEKVAKVQQ